MRNNLCTKINLIDELIEHTQGEIFEMTFKREVPKKTYSTLKSVTGYAHPLKRENGVHYKSLNLTNAKYSELSEEEKKFVYTSLECDITMSCCTGVLREGSYEAPPVKGILRVYSPERGFLTINTESVSKIKFEGIELSFN